MKNKEKLQRSKSETNLKSPTNNNKTEKAPPGGEPTPIVQALSKSYDLQSTLSGQDLRQMGARPKSWSPDNLATREAKEGIKSSPGFMSLEDLSQKSASKESVQESKSSLARHVLMPCDNGESYSVSPNQIVHLPGHDTTSNPSRPEEKKRSGESDYSSYNSNSNSSNPKTVIANSETWDPGEGSVKQADRTLFSDSTSSAVCDQKFNSVRPGDSSAPVWTSSAVIVTQSAVSSSSYSEVPESRSKHTTAVNQSDLFSNQLDRVFDKEEKKQQRRSTIQVTAENISAPSADDGKHPRECPSRQSSWSSYDSAVVMGFPEKNELSRHSSWGSGDTRLLPSRNSSWGSYDMRPRGSVYYNNEKGEKILHSASDLEKTTGGIFPYDKEDIPWHPGTVKRTKQRLETSTATPRQSSITSSCQSLTKTPSSETLLFNFAEAVNDSLVERGKTTADVNSVISDKIDIPSVDKAVPLMPNLVRLSVSAPEPCSMELAVQECSLSRSASNVSSLKEAAQPDEASADDTEQYTSSVQKQKSFLENLHKDLQTHARKTEETFDSASSLGKVQNLKKEFEAKSSTTCLETNASTDHSDTLKVSKNRVSSLPSSPVCVHQIKEQPQKVVSDDLNFKTIRSVFENKEESQVKMRQKYAKPSKNNSRHSCFEVSVDKNPRITPIISNLSKTAKNDGEYKRPPIVPAVKQIAATVIATAAKKQQQYGKTHPLARINIKPRHNNPVYNTM